MMLYHYCCRHSARLIVKSGLLKPLAQPMMSGLPAVWATDMEIPDRDALGLTMFMVKCDRTEERFRVHPDDESLFTHWPVSPLRALVRNIEAFEHEPLDPVRWWISIRSVRVTP